jgi:GNAT superfamily N-acetyltransferase
VSVVGYRAGLAAAMELPVERFDEPGVTVVPGEDRRGERLVSLYEVGRHAVVWVDPEIAGEVSSWDGRPTTPSFDEFGAWVLGAGGELLGEGWEHLLPGPFDAPARPVPVRTLDGGDDRCVDLVRRLQSGCSADDLDEADFDPEALDRFLVGWIEDGELLALAGGRPLSIRPGFHDVGVLVHPAGRRAGRGRAVVAGAVEEVLAAGEMALYRCGSQNVGSQRLCRSLGFERVLRLRGYRWADSG